MEILLIIVTKDYALILYIKRSEKAPAFFPYVKAVMKAGCIWFLI